MVEDWDGEAPPGWDDGPWANEDLASWPDPAMQKRIAQIGRLLVSALFGLVPAALARGFHPLSVWLVSTLAFHWLLGSLIKRAAR
jgi:hypothetical protein